MSVGRDNANLRYVFGLAMLAVILIAMVALWAVLKADQPNTNTIVHLFIVSVPLALSALIAVTIDYLVKRRLTQRKRAEDASAMGRRLIEAQERERTWIARELHDDVNQRLALLTIELERWNDHIGNSSANDLRLWIRETRNRIFEISKDVQALSHRLHSSKLEYLGIVAAANSFCKEMSEQHDVRIEFLSADVSRRVPSELALSLFRVLQEAVHNAVKHSQSQEFKVELRGTGGGIHLTVTDRGRGFDQQRAVTGSGLGLISMRERLQLVNGTLAIESNEGRGTTIRACVPFEAETDLRAAA